MLGPPTSMYGTDSPAMPFNLVNLGSAADIPTRLNDRGSMATCPVTSTATAIR